MFGLHLLDSSFFTLHFFSFFRRFVIHPPVFCHPERSLRSRRICKRQQTQLSSTRNQILHYVQTSC